VSYKYINSKNDVYYVNSGENAADLDSLIQMSLNLQAAQETWGTYLCLSPPSES